MYWNGCGYWPESLSGASARPWRERRLAKWAQHGVTWSRESMHSTAERDRQNAQAKLRLHLAVMYCPTLEATLRHRMTVARILAGKGLPEE